MQIDRNAKAVVALVYFDSGTTVKQAKQIIADLADHREREKNGPYIEGFTVQEYNPTLGGVTIYQP